MELSVYPSFRLLVRLIDRQHMDRETSPLPHTHANTAHTTAHDLENAKTAAINQSTEAYTDYCSASHGISRLK